MTIPLKPSTDDQQYFLPWYPGGMKRAAIYIRAPAADQRQDPEAQLRQLRDYAGQRGFLIAYEYVDYADGTKGDRTAYRTMLRAARRREFDVILIWRYDCFARSMRELVNALARFESLRIDFISYSEGADTTTPQGKLLFGIMASLAEFERSLIAERVKAGMKRAKQQGKHTGRPPLSPLTRDAIRKLLAAKPPLSIRAIARRTGVSATTVQKVRDAR